MSHAERLYRLLSAAIDGGRIPKIVEAEPSTLFALALYSEPKLVSISLELLRVQFRQKENLIDALSEIQVCARARRRGLPCASPLAPPPPTTAPRMPLPPPPPPGRALTRRTGGSGS